MATYQVFEAGLSPGFFHARRREAWGRGGLSDPADRHAAAKAVAGDGEAECTTLPRAVRIGSGCQTWALPQSTKISVPAT
jgi:hypothetical protein